MGNIFSRIFGKNKSVPTNFERQWASDTFKPAAEGLTRQGQEGINAFMAALQGTDGGAGFEQFSRSTGFNNVLNEAMRGVSGSAAARGLLGSGSTARALQNRAGQMAQGNFQNYLQSLLSGANTALTGGLNAGNAIIGASGVERTRSRGLFDVLPGIGRVASGVGSMIAASDPRLKEDIELIDVKPDGLGVYRYRYEGEEEVRVGVMADEVARLRPEALGPIVDGYMTVDYAKLSDVAHG